jgi:hypothetical protein
VIRPLRSIVLEARIDADDETVGDLQRSLGHAAASLVDSGAAAAL